MKKNKNKKIERATIQFCGGAGVVTGVCYLLQFGGHKILVDCGLYQGEPDLEKRNQEGFPFDPKEIDGVIITHSHLDHIGRLPRLIEAGFGGKIFATPPTIDFTRLVLDDSAKVLAEKAQKAGVLPLFGANQVSDVLKRFVPTGYYKKTEVVDGINFTFHNAGHILGSAFAEVEIDGKIIVFSGDLGHSPVPLLPPPDFLENADYVLIESTYGDRNHETMDECKEVIENLIEETISRKSVLLIPSFALERTQQIIYHLNDLAENHRIPEIPVFIDSPLALRMTEAYRRYPEYYNQETIDKIKSGDDIFKFSGLHFTHSSKESKEINDVSPPKVIIAGSGMSQGGRIVHHEIRYLPDPNNILLLVTYQAAGTLGRKISEGAREVEIHDQRVEINARLARISGYSSHADQRYLMKWLKSFHKPGYPEVNEKGGRLKKVFVVQGEEKSASTLAGLIRDELGVEADMPKINDIVELE